jgi:hypothetical protein
MNPRLSSIVPHSLALQSDARRPPFTKTQILLIEKLLAVSQNTLASSQSKMAFVPSLKSKGAFYR